LLLSQTDAKTKEKKKIKKKIKEKKRKEEEEETKRGKEDGGWVCSKYYRQEMKSLLPHSIFHLPSSTYDVF
jgi:hypothetical protein